MTRATIRGGDTTDAPTVYSGLEYMNNEEQIWLSAVRYGLGRRTYITGIIADFMKKNITNMTQDCKDIMWRDIYNTKDLGDQQDAAHWLDLMDTLAEDKIKVI